MFCNNCGMDLSCENVEFCSESCEIKYKEKHISNDMFVKEMQILWENNIRARKLLGCLIRDYFDEGCRADKIINKMKGE